MSQLPPPDARTSGGAHGLSGDGHDGDLPSRIMRIALVPALVVALLGTLTACVLLAATAAWLTYSMLGVALVGSAVACIDGARRAKATAQVIQRDFADAAQDVQTSITELRSLIARGRNDMEQLVTRIRNGERPTPGEPPGEPTNQGSPFQALGYELMQAQHAAAVAVIQSARPILGSDRDNRVTVFVNLGRRLQSLTHREIQMLDELESQVEDPELLKGLFSVDHLATGVRRQAESLVVLGGGKSGRKWTAPVPIYTVLRSAVSEVEQYARIKVVQPGEGTVRGHAVADVIHLFAELVENATAFSDPKTQVDLRVQSVTAGLAIEIQDRGLGMPSDQLQRLNELLATPTKIDIGELLEDGRIGLHVVAELTRRHGIAVRLQTNIYGGIDAVVVLPHELLGDEPQQPHQSTQPAPRDPAPLVTSHAGDLMWPPTNGHTPRSGTAPGAHHSERPRLAGESRPAHDSQPAAPTEHTRQNPRVSPAPGSVVTPTPPPDPGRDHSADNEVRPPLPKRSRGTNLRPELRQPPGADKPAAADHQPDLMAAFQQGINRSTTEKHTPPEPSS